MATQKRLPNEIIEPVIESICGFLAWWECFARIPARPSCSQARRPSLLAFDSVGPRQEARPKENRVLRYFLRLN